MGAPLTPISPTLRHGPPNALCRSVARNYQFPRQGNEIVGKGGGRGGEGNKGGRQNWCSRQSVAGDFFVFFALGIFSWNFWEQKKWRGTHLLDPLIGTVQDDFWTVQVKIGTVQDADLTNSGEILGRYMVIFSTK